MIRAADPKTRPQVLEILDSARDLGLKVLRIWAFSEGPIQYNTLQRYPGASACLARPLASASALWRIKGKSILWSRRSILLQRRIRPHDIGQPLRA